MFDCKVDHILVLFQSVDRSHGSENTRSSFDFIKDEAAGDSRVICDCEGKVGNLTGAGEAQEAGRDEDVV